MAMLNNQRVYPHSEYSFTAVNSEMHESNDPVVQALTENFQLQRSTNDSGRCEGPPSTFRPRELKEGLRNLMILMAPRSRTEQILE